MVIPKSLYRIIFNPLQFFESEINSRTPKSSTFLAGVDAILERCTNYCTRQLLIHSQKTSVHGRTLDTIVSIANSYIDVVC